MKHQLISLAFGLAFAGAAPAQSGGQQSISAALNIYVFPKTGQSAAKQSEDEAACYQWSVGQSGVDPFQMQKQEAAQQQQAQAAQQQAAQAGQGSGARGAVGGAAAGALIGEIGSGNAGRGAAWGAVLGGVAGRVHGSKEQAAAQQQAAQTQQALGATEAQMDNFNKAFSACLEAKDYIVKF